MSEKQIFDVLLEKRENMEATGITIPFDVEKVFGAKCVPVKVSINSAEYRSTVIRMSGKYMMTVPKSLRETVNIKAGDLIKVSMEKDLEKRAVEIPNDLAEALTTNNLTETFAKMSFTHRKE